MTLIKICGISDPNMAREAARANAHYIGLVFHPQSKRAVTKEEALPIVKTIKEEGALPVAVFKDECFAIMKDICEKTGIDIVQLHGDTSRREHHFLPQNYQRIFAMSAVNISTFSSEGLDQKRDFILIDSDTPGEGKCLDWGTFHYHLPFRWFLAGGLNEKNVARAITLLHPNGVDVSSGVESQPGQKDATLISQFIRAVKEAE